MNKHMPVLERKPAPPPARLSVPGLTVTHRCSCGGTVGPGGECAACRAKRLRADNGAGKAPGSEGNLARMSGVRREPGQVARPAGFATSGPRPGHDFGRIAVLDSRDQAGDAALATITPTEDWSEGEFATLSAHRQLETATDAGRADLLQTQVADAGPAPDAGPARMSHCTPTGRFTAIPSGTLGAVFGGGKFGRSFNMNAEFAAPVPCTCVCGEYRQFVRGFAKHNGTNVVHRLCSNTLHPTTWHEDCKTSGGRDLKYGYHSIPFPTSTFTNPDQATGCTFNGFDHPGFPLSSVSTGDRLELHLEFQGKLVDACNGNAVLRSSSWTVAGTGTVP